MSIRDYIPTGDENNRKRVFESLRSEDEELYFDIQERKRLDAIAKCRRALDELLESNIPKTYFEIVKPLGKLATLSRKNNPFYKGNIIRANSIMITSKPTRHMITDENAELIPARGYILPGIKGEVSRFSTAIFSDGSTGTTMHWDQYTKKESNKVENWIPPENAYWCDASDRFKFYPINNEDHFEPRECTPVWGRSIEKLENIKSAVSINQLAQRITNLFLFDNMEIIVDQYGSDNF